MRVGFVGLGHMGQAMASNLVTAGHEVHVWNRSPEPVRALVERGAKAASDVAGAFDAEVVISMLADDDVVRRVIVSSGVLDRARDGVVHVNMATISVSLAQELAKLHRERGIDYVAAPVFGRPDAAAAAKLTIVAAGASDSIDRVQPLFDAMGHRTWRMGVEPHRANVVKLAGNFMLVAGIAAMGEAVALAEANGVAPRELVDMLTGSVFTAPFYKGYGTLMAEGRYEPPGFRLALGLKDVKLALEAAEQGGASPEIGGVLRSKLERAIANGDGEKDLAAIARADLAQVEAHR